MKIALLEPFYTGSHKRFADSLVKHSSHQITLFTLQGRFWKWRMHGAAISLANQYLESKEQFDFILATDMLDFSTFLALTRKKSIGCKTGIYFHENQISYPWSPNDSDPREGRDIHYGFINYTSALVSDKVFFNSKYHMDSFIDGCEALLVKFPDHRELNELKKLKNKSEVLSLGMELSQFDHYKQKNDHKTPIVLWNHRWEYDKNPELFFQTLLNIKNEGIKFKLCVLGEQNKSIPKIMSQIPEVFENELIQYGEVKTFKEYATWLWNADIHPTTSNQDFFGMSVVEGLYCQCHSLLPKRLAYPEHLNESEVFYETEDEFYVKLRALIVSNQKKSFDQYVRKYDWSQMIINYDQSFEFD